MGIKNLRGKRYGKLTCIEPTGERGTDGCMVWRCKCDCGGECLTTAAQLNRGDRKSCGCLQRGPQMLQEGQRFGMLVVLGYAGIQNRRRSWRCRCDCGNECVVSGSSLSSGKRKSCGCIRPPEERDLVGQRFGALVVTGFSGKRDGKRYWLCQCDCGNVTEVWQSNLLSGHTKSCGCLQNQIYQDNLRLVDGTWNSYFLRPTSKFAYEPEVSEDDELSIAETLTDEKRLRTTFEKPTDRKSVV